MTAAFSVIADVLTAFLLITGATLAFVGSLGLLRLRRSFYERVHSPTLGTTLGIFCIALASIICFSASGERAAVHELLLIFFVTVTTPVSLIVLVRAATLRDAAEGVKSVDNASR